MAGVGITLFGSIYASFPDARSLVRVNKRDVIARAFCTGIEAERDSTETGLHNQAAGTIRFLVSDEPEKKIMPGTLIEVKTPAMTEYQSVRVNIRYVSGGAVRLEVEAEFQ